MVLREHFKSSPFFFFKRNAFGIMGGSVAIISDRKHESHFSRPVARCSGLLAIGIACSFSAFGKSLHANRDASESATHGWFWVKLVETGLQR